ncbi:unnamed protein product [Adineta steineri]|uniref:Peptidase C1A papain C-terminal domain-containing protein n=1 Tax=Adineta steineri TaxID=433720 RepID=A0A815BU34_9BILA|nr:unnamed protein product [Adineta steineri]CAF3814759.1 unnamed protein product [Adineta steineri]
MDPPKAVYDQQKKNAELLRRRLKFPVLHGYKLPPKVDLRRWMTKIHDQGDMGSCVANAVAGALEYLYRRYSRQDVNISRLFIDFNARLSNINWTTNQNFFIDPEDPGDTFDTNRQAAVRGVQQYGFCSESLWPYDRSLYMRVPAKKAYEDASRRSIIPLKVPINITSVKTCLAHDIPVLVGISISTDEAYHNRGWVQIPEVPPTEGLHACLVVGYDDRTRHFIIRNSWGAEWGDKGYCYLPYEYLIDRRLVATADSFWAIAQILPRKQVRRGYFSYPNFTRYHQQHMLPVTTEYYTDGRQNYPYRLKNQLLSWLNFIR